ncbi:sigma-70 family RNA polymerase sigma factor [Saccharopolyspora taberi]|uniref:Sigma-70 family RNA polymerase sigma factor n=1 Tax=Saccharopolyspora taberi TaxID=60895 RepID=A0ABN3VJT9_9PSEU
MPDAASDAFERVYRAHHRSVLGYLLRRADEQTAQDALSETFLVAWRRLGDVPADDPLPWLLGVARRALANQRRAGARQEALRDKVALHTPRTRAHEDDSAPLIAEAMRRLSESDREVLSLHAWEDLSVERIAEVLGCTRPTARLRLHRARKRLLRALGEIEAAP